MPKKKPRSRSKKSAGSKETPDKQKRAPGEVWSLPIERACLNLGGIINEKIWS